MNQTKDELDRQINDFLERKFKKYPDLNDSISDRY